MISQDRLAADLAHMQTITAPGPGINRLAFTDSDWQGRAYLMHCMREAGLTLRTDAFGNVIGRLAGTHDELPAVMFGSHGDSVPEGGNFDGIVGILSAIEVIRSLREDGFQPEHPLVVVLFMCEESSRFGSATLGSKAMRGELKPDDLQRLHDKQGHSLYEVLKARDLDPDHIEAAKYTAPVKSFFEVHIEQGRVLEATHNQIGIVTGIAAPTRFRIQLQGQADHSGATPMNLRHDALCAAAEIVLETERLARSQTDPPVVGTIGCLDLEPGAMNVIPGQVTLSVDIRSISAEAKAAVADAVRQYAREHAAARQIECTIEEISQEQPARMNPAVIDMFQHICDNAHLESLQLPSGAGHDSMHWAGYAPTGMLFIPCRDGISHNPAEHAELEDITAAARVLDAAVRQASRTGFTFA